MAAGGEGRDVAGVLDDDDALASRRAMGEGRREAEWEVTRGHRHLPVGRWPSMLNG